MKSHAPATESLTSLIIHGHFYQPPRENPWTGLIDREPSAQPFHDWNERIHQECYRPNAYARVMDGAGRVARMVNNYERLSFNIGPTLFSWIERWHPEAYRRIQQADRDSAARLGHGNAIAQGYNHMILPLCSERDRRTQVRWGVADFQHRFARAPESLWLPETAINAATLGLLIDEGLRYVVLSPYQAERARPLSAREVPTPDGCWRDVADGSIDPSVAYRAYHPDGSGRYIAVFFYDGPIARAIAFEGLLTDSDSLLARCRLAGRGPGQVVNIATDGESYGHHFRLGERCVAYALGELAERRGFHVTNYGAFLDRHPPAHEVELKPGPDGEGTAWSCAHGVGRWYRDCGCQTGGPPEWTQAWRGPLRQALDFLRDRVAAITEEQGAALFSGGDFFAARDAYVQVLLAKSRGAGELAAAQQAFLERHQARPLSIEDQRRALTLMEASTSAMLMYTSCGWFFTELSGIETLQVLKYAARTLDLLDRLAGSGESDVPALREDLLQRLAEARSNLPELGTGADLFRRFAEPARVTSSGVAAHVALSGLLGDGDIPELSPAGQGHFAGQRVERSAYQRERHGRVTLATGRLRLQEEATLGEVDRAFAALHFGGIDFYAAMQDYPGDAAFQQAVDALWGAFRTASLPRLLRLLGEHFGPDEYGLPSVLPEGRARIARVVFSGLLNHLSDQFAHLHQENQRVIDMLGEAGFALPDELRIAAEFTLSRRFDREIRQQQRSADPAAYQRAIAIAEEAARRGCAIDRSAASFVFEDMIAGAARRAIEAPAEDHVAAVRALLDLGARLGLVLTLQRAQDAVYDALQQTAPADDKIPLTELAILLRLSPELVASQPASRE